MKKNRGFRIGHKLVNVFKFVFRRKSKPSKLHRLDPPTSNGSKTMTAIRNWGRQLRGKAERLRFSSSSSGYIRLDQDAAEPELETPKQSSAPKGHLAVYVGEKGGDTQRIFVPVIYFNHPLFGELLRKAENEYGFDHPGGIIFPCRRSDFESVQMRIAAGESSLRRSWRR